MRAADDLYRDLIMQHSRNPHHYGMLPNATHTVIGDNPLCGDRYTIQLEVDGTGTIGDAAFEGSGCAISKASASLMLDSIIGLSRAEFEARCNLFEALLRGAIQDTATLDRLGPLAAFSGLSKYPARVPCAILCWQTVRTALHNG